LATSMEGQVSSRVVDTVMRKMTRGWCEPVVWLQTFTLEAKSTLPGVIPSNTRYWEQEYIFSGTGVSLSFRIRPIHLLSE